MPYLQTYFEGQLSAELELGDQTISVGRGSDCDVRINNAGISSFHAIISPEGKSFVIEDAASTNGLTINGRRSHRHTLQFDDEVELPKHTLRFVEKSAGVELPTSVSPGELDGQSATFEVDTSGLRDMVADRQAERAAVLTIVTKRRKPLDQPLTKIHTTIGKGRDCDIRTQGWRAPKLAATISRTPDGFQLTPEAGADVELNGSGVSAPQRLARGDIIRIVDLTMNFSSPEAA